MHEAGEARLLVALEEVRRRRPGRPRARRRRRARATVPEHRQLPPRRAADEEHRAERGEVDERRAEVGLREDEDDGNRAEAERAQRRADVAAAARALGEEARRARARTASFPNSDGWNVKKPTLIQRVEPRAARPTTKTIAISVDGADEDGPPVAAVDVRVDERRDDEQRRRRRRRRPSAGRGSSSDCPRRRSASRRRRPRARRRRGRRRRRAAASRASGGRRRTASPSPRSARQSCALRSGVLEHQSECAHRRGQSLWMGPRMWNFTWKNDAKTCAAAGAAASPPWPPFSITAQTTIFAASVGPYPHHQDWFWTPM